jgi:hypothetical protein
MLYLGVLCKFIFTRVARVNPANYFVHLLFHCIERSTVLYPPRNVDVNVSSNGLYAESDVLVCRADGLPKPTFLWLQSPDEDHLPMSLKTNRAIGEGAVMTLHQFVGTPRRRLRCQATNHIRNVVHQTSSEEILINMAAELTASDAKSVGLDAGSLASSSLTSSDANNAGSDGTVPGNSLFVGVVAVTSALLLLSVACVSSAVLVSMRRGVSHQERHQTYSSLWSANPPLRETRGKLEDNWEKLGDNFYEQISERPHTVEGSEVDDRREMYEIMLTMTPTNFI